MSLLQNLISQNTVRRFDLVIFDLDGTLLDTSEGILSSIRFTTDHFHLRPIPEERIRSFIGPPIQWSFMKEYGLSVEKGNDYAAVFRDRYKNYDLMKAVPYPGIIEAMKKLKAMGCKLAVATYKREDYALELLERYAFLEQCSIAHGCDFAGKRKKADIIRMCIEEAAINDRDRAVLVGDTESDRNGALEAGIHFIGVTYGFGYKKWMYADGADAMIMTPDELIRAVCKENEP